MLLIPPIQQLMLLIRRAARSHRLLNPPSILPNSIDAGFSCTGGTWKKPHVVSPSQIKRGQSMTTAAPTEDEGEFIYLPLLHIMSPRTRWLTCTERRAQHSSSGSRCPFWSHRTFRLLAAETRTVRGNEAGWTRALTHVEQQGSMVGRRRCRGFEEDFESIGSGTSVAGITC